MKKTNRIIILVLIIFTFVCLILFQLSRSWTFQFFGNLTDRVETNEKVIALTFDDAPTGHTPAILDMLAAKNVKATFYVIGKNIEEHPDIAKRIVAEGHELGNHSYSHRRLVMKSQSYIDKEIQTTNALIREAGYAGNITFRPPYGKKLFGLPWYLKRHGMTTVMWDIGTDWHRSGADNMVEYTLSHAKPGSIILMHPFYGNFSDDRDALSRIIDGFHEKGYGFVTVTDLLGRK